MRRASSGPADWPTYHHRARLKSRARATQPRLHHAASLNVTLGAPPWRISSRSATSASSTRPENPAHSQTLPIVSIINVPGRSKDGRGSWRRGTLLWEPGTHLRRRGEGLAHGPGPPWDRGIGMPEMTAVTLGATPLRRR